MRRRFSVIAASLILAFALTYAAAVVAMVFLHGLAGAAKPTKPSPYVKVRP